MNIKKEIKKLLEDRKLRLVFVRMDQKFYQETFADLLSYNTKELEDRIVEIEAELKRMTNWKKTEKTEKRKAQLRQRYEKIQEFLDKVRGVRQALYNLSQKERDLKEYIEFLEDFIKKERWKKLI